ncbi:MAG: hypothetical protein H7A37_09680 [Chlamydiales bacterium]|nr:hypothetical protein [Chlamydiia bacterium]MCP5508546.1 hypothetical protein [Chlamydiales bacterium]
MSSIEVAAKEAVKVIKRAIGDDKTEEEVSNYQGRNYKHWSYYLLVTGAIVGAATAIIAAIIGITTLIVAGAALFVCNAIGAYYIARFDTYNDLEDLADILTKKVRQLADHVLNFEKLNQREEELNDQHEEFIEDDKLLNDELIAIRRKFQEAMEEEHEQHLDELEKLAHENDKLCAKLAELEASHDSLETKYEQMLETFKNFTLNTRKFSNKNDAFIASVNKLAQVKKEMRSVVDRMQEIKRQRRSVSHRVDLKQIVRDMEQLVQQLQDRPLINVEEKQEYINNIDLLIDLLKLIAQSFSTKREHLVSGSR